MQQQIEPIPMTAQDELTHDIEEVFGDAERWLQIPNSYFGGLKNGYSAKSAFQQPTLDSDRSTWLVVAQRPDNLSVMAGLLLPRYTCSKPQEFIDHGYSDRIRNLLGMIKQGMFS